MSPESSSTGEQWRIDGHNGIWVIPETGESGVDKEAKRALRVVNRESEKEYIEFAVARESAVELRDYLNALQAQISSTREALELLPDRMEAMADAERDDGIDPHSTISGLVLLARQHLAALSTTPIPPAAKEEAK